MRLKKEKPQVGVVYNTFFIHYDEDGKVHILSNEKNTDYKIFEIDLFLIEDFLTGKKDHNTYNIEYFFNLSKGIITADSNTVEYSKPLFQLIPVTDVSDSDILLEYNFKNKYWQVTASDDAYDKLEVLPALAFYVCKKNDPHFLYRSFTVSTEDLQKGSVTCDFITDAEHKFDEISVVTLKRFGKYTIKVV
jgi:hypothetical protein